MKRQQRPFTPEEKVRILKRHLVDKVPVSNLGDELGLQPTAFYYWQTEFFERGAQAFARPSDSRQRKQEQRIKELEEKLQRKHEVLSELSEEYVQQKKSWGGVRGGWVAHDVRNNRLHPTGYGSDGVSIVILFFAGFGLVGIKEKMGAPKLSQFSACSYSLSTEKPMIQRPQEFTVPNNRSHYRKVPPQNRSLFSI